MKNAAKLGWALVLAVTGCANSRPVTFHFTTDPPGATCFIFRDVEQLGRLESTPGDITVIPGADRLTATCGLSLKSASYPNGRRVWFDGKQLLVGDVGGDGKPVPVDMKLPETVPPPVK